MPVNLSVAARDGSAYAVTLGFTDFDGSVATPKTLNWTMTDTQGVIINGRENVVAAPASIMRLMFMGADLYFEDGTVRVILVDYVYDSVIYGPDIRVREEVRFPVIDLLKVKKPA